MLILFLFFFCIGPTFCTRPYIQCFVRLCSVTLFLLEAICNQVWEILKHEMLLLVSPATPEKQHRITNSKCDGSKQCAISSLFHTSGNTFTPTKGRSRSCKGSCSSSSLRISQSPKFSSGTSCLAQLGLMFTGLQLGLDQS